MTKLKLKIRDLKKAFGRKEVLRGIDLDVGVGESLVILGGSGSGKSVLLKNMIGLIKPDSGTIHIDGQEVTGLNARDREKLMPKFGMLFQGGALFDSLSVRENITFGLAQRRRLSRNESEEIAVEMLRRVGLGPDVAGLSPSELSGGMQKRVSLARAICTEPEIIFFDEPTTGLDPIMAGVINDLIRETVLNMGTTAVTITHNMSSMHAIADRVAMLYQGRILWTGTEAEVSETDNPYVHQFTHGLAEGPISSLV